MTITRVKAHERRADYSPTFERAMGGYNFSGWGLRCKHCGHRLTHAHYSADGWDAEHVGWSSESDGFCDNPEPLSSAHVGRNTHDTWTLIDPWGTVWAIGFRTRLEAADFAYRLVLRHAALHGSAAN